MAEHDHMCSWGCGNVADNVLINLNTSEADILCTPCFLRLANDISEQFLKALDADAEGSALHDPADEPNHNFLADQAEKPKAQDAEPEGQAVELDASVPPPGADLPAAFR